MKIKNFIKKKLGKNYYKFRLKYILHKVFGRFYILTRKYLKKIYSKLNFIKTNLNKKIEHQSIVTKEAGFLIDFTKDNYLTFHLRPKKSENFHLKSTDKTEEKFAIIIQGLIQDNFFF